MTGPDVWGRFTHDPRLPEYAGLRAADADRDVVHDVLTEAYADGRLDRSEFDTRTEAVAGARTLGELPAALDGLVLTAPVPALREGTALATSGIEARALQKWKDDRRSAIGGFVSASVICWIIWSAVMFGGFPWPLFVMLGTGLHAGRVVFMKDEIIAAEKARLEKKQRKELRRHGDEG